MSTQTLVLGVLLIVSLMVVARIFRKSLGSFDEHFQDFKRNLQKTEKEVRNGNFSISMNEQMAVVRAALNEELDLAGHPTGCYIENADSSRLIRLHTPQGCFEIAFTCKSVRLHSQNRVLHGGGQWALRGPEGQIGTENLAEVMQSLRNVIRGGPLLNDEGGEFRRRFPA